MAVVSFGISSLSISALILNPFFDEYGRRVLSYTVASVFWLFLIGGIYFMKRASISIRRIKVKKFMSGALKKQKLPGAFTFTAQWPNVLLYAIIVIAVALGISDVIFHWLPAVIMLPLLSLALFAFSIHCIFDGQDYKAFNYIVHNDIKEGKGNE